MNTDMYQYIQWISICTNIYNEYRYIPIYTMNIDMYQYKQWIPICTNIYNEYRYIPIYIINYISINVYSSYSKIKRNFKSAYAWHIDETSSELQRSLYILLSVIRKYDERLRREIMNIIWIIIFKTTCITPTIRTFLLMLWTISIFKCISIYIAFNVS